MTVATVGDSATTHMTVSTDEIENYAALVGDDNPLHVDDGYAAETMFEGRIAHGMLPAGLVSAALADLPGDVVYVSQDLEFRAPVRPGDTVAATVEVVEDLGEGQLRVRTTATVDDTTVLSGEAVVLSLAHEPADGSCEAEAGAD